MTSLEIREKFLAFFERRGHSIIPSSSLVPENDPTVLFNTAGMQPLIPFLMGEKHPSGDRLVSVQKCVRTTDIDDIGDRTHGTFFEMLGNWSLGSYFKDEAIRWSFEFLTSKSEGLGLDPSRFYITVFEGIAEATRDDDSAKIWRNVGIPADRIFYKGADSNWWPAVKEKDEWSGPTGPCTEMFYDVTGHVGALRNVRDFETADSEQKIVELWNDVFMEYEKRAGKIIGRLKQRNVDTGAGLERLAMIMQGKNNIFETDLFLPIVEKILELSGTDELTAGRNERAVRIIADHVRTSVFLVADGVTPSNTDRGYILRRLIRRAIRFGDILGFKTNDIAKVASCVPNIYESYYPNLKSRLEQIEAIITEEERKFRQTLSAGIREIAKTAVNNVITGESAFNLFSVFGIPPDVTTDEARILNITIDPDFERDFSDAQTKHREISRAGSAQRFKGGLIDASDQSMKYHTTTHLLNAVLRKILGDHVEQKGSNITAERLRFDFVHDKKLTDEEKKMIEDAVNLKIGENLEVSCDEMALDKAREIGAVGVFGERYADIVKVYSIGDNRSSVYFSREICGGPHVKSTGGLGRFKIVKEEAVSAGVRRIKAVLL